MAVELRKINVQVMLDPFVNFCDSIYVLGMIHQKMRFVPCLALYPIQGSNFYVMCVVSIS